MSEENDSPGFREFRFIPGDFSVTPDIQKAFDTDGGIIVKKLLSDAELAKIHESLQSSNSVTQKAWEVTDFAEGKRRLVIWNQPGNDVTGMVARSEKVATTCEKLLGGEVYHYHSKLMMKDARTGGQHHWHQDYGYWYINGCLRPDMMSVFIALDPCVKANGGLQVVKGTHRCGRIEHSFHSGKAQADQTRLDELLKHFPHSYVSLQPGDAVFFHSNVLHTSDKNLSDMRRWAMICCYNRADNDAVYPHHHGPYTPLRKVPDTSILGCDTLSDLSGKDFMDPSYYKPTTEAGPRVH